MLYIPIDDILILCKDHKLPLLPRHNMKTYSELGGWIESWVLRDNVVSHAIYSGTLCSVRSTDKYVHVLLLGRIA